MIAISVGKATYAVTIPVDNFPVENTKMLLNEKIESSGGAACNVAQVLAKWNVETYFAGVLGYDDYGTSIKKDLENERIKTNYVETNYEKKTTTSYIITNKANSSRTIMMVEPEVFHLKKYDFDVNADLIYSDGFEYTASTAAFNHYPNAITVLGASLDKGSDPKEVLALAKYVKYIIFSLDFAERLTKLKTDFSNPQTLLNLYQDLKEKYPKNEIIVTLKNMGAMYQLGNEVKVMPTISVTEVDRTGSGDIFDGAFLYGLGKNYDIEKCIRLANIAAGLSTTKYGVKNSIPLLSDVISYYEKKFGPLDAPVNQPVQSQTPPQVNQQPNQNPNPDQVVNQQTTQTTSINNNQTGV